MPAATAKARAEAAKMQKHDRRGRRAASSSRRGTGSSTPSRCARPKYDLDESQIKPYFELDHVLQDGVFFAANKLYGLTFKERNDIPVYQPDVRVFEVFDADGKSLALFYADYFTRDEQERRRVDGQLRRSDRACSARSRSSSTSRNFTKPAPGQPALLTFDDVTTMFHEFGHALHGMFSNVKYPTLAGTNVPRDFVEFPSQFNEHWALEPTRVRELREALPDRRADAAGAGRQDQEVAHVQPGLRDDRVPRGRAARHGLAHAAAPARRSRTSTRSSRRR